MPTLHTQTGSTSATKAEPRSAAGADRIPASRFAEVPATARVLFVAEPVNRRSISSRFHEAPRFDLTLNCGGRTFMV
jgi:hypothetical protein